MDSQAHRQFPVGVRMGLHHRSYSSRSWVEDMVNIMVLSRVNLGEVLDTSAVEALWIAERPDMSDAEFVCCYSGEVIVHCRDKTYQVKRLPFYPGRVVFSEVY